MVMMMRNEAAAATRNYAKIVMAPPGPKAKEEIALGSKHIWTNNYQMHPEIVAAEAHGSIITDVDGNRFIDGLSGVGVNALGYDHPRLNQARDEIRKKGYAHLNYHVLKYPEYRMLVDTAMNTLPSPLNTGEGFLCNSGAEANEAALKLAKNLTGKPIIMGSDQSFHGRTSGVLGGTSGPNGKIGMEPFVGKAAWAIFKRPNIYRAPDGADPTEISIESIENVLREYHDQVAAIILEPISGEPGVLPLPKGYGRKLNDLVKANGLLLIADEVQTGLGKTGKMWGMEHEGLAADIVTSAKALGGGLPLGGMFAKRELMDKWPKGAHASTFGGNAESCAVGVAAINVITEENLVENARKIEEHVVGRLRSEFYDKHEIIGDIRAAGTLIGIELVKDRRTKEVDKETEAVAAAINSTAVQKGLIMSVTGALHNVVRWSFALNTPMPVVDEFVDIFDETMAAVVKR